MVIKISVLKEYLATDLMFSCSNVDWDICKAINDWIFICFFVGNDFLPHIPTLEIRENAITVVISIWKRMMQKWDGYLTDRGNANVERVLELMKELSYMEPLILSRRYKRDSNRGGRFSGIRRAQNESMNNIGYGNINSGNSYGEAISSDVYHQYDNASRPELSVCNSVFSLCTVKKLPLKLYRCNRDLWIVIGWRNITCPSLDCLKLEIPSARISLENT